ncbi:hypothetical protein KKF91_03910 [Myxococcota bacterium]|nr:hypothetical protein [Myxococcota bacterium]MBU1429689.1 hypothetical protein [Myxococcota bacterium]MBU1898618.1 hypothetical protein [Myxococcota bacterium]
MTQASASPRRLSALIASLISLTSAAQAAPPAIFADAQAGVGLELGSGGNQTRARRGPAFISLEAGYTFDPLYDAQFDLEGVIYLDTARVGLAPGVRLTRGAHWRYFIGLKAPWIIRPASLFGARLLAGLIAPLGWVSITSQVQADAFVAGSDLPEDGAFIALNWSVGGRLDF